MNTIEFFEELPDYSTWRPTPFDTAGLISDLGSFKVLPVSQTRDSGPLERSNFRTAVNMLRGETDHVQIHRFRHWGPGWFELILIDPTAPKEIKTIAGEIVTSLADYPVLDDEDFSTEEMIEANEIWQNCYDWKDRVKYIRENRSQFDFHSLPDMIATVRGIYFSGYAGELIS